MRKGEWFEEDEVKNCKLVWQGLFYMMWHADKAVYQRETAAKIAGIIVLLDIERVKVWVEACLSIYNYHFEEIDNFRMDKYLSLLRFNLNQLLRKIVPNFEESAEWFLTLMAKVLEDYEPGIALHFTDIILQELHDTSAD